MLDSSETIFLMMALALFGIANLFIGRDIFKPLLLVYGFAFGTAFVAGFAAATNTEPSVTAIFIVGGMCALLSFLVYYVGVAILGVGAGWYIIFQIALQLGSDPAPLLLLATAIICGGVAVAFHDYVVIAVTALGGAGMIVNAVLLLLPDTRAHFDILDGYELVNVPPAASVIGILAMLFLAGGGAYMQYKSYIEHHHQSY